MKRGADQLALDWLKDEIAATLQQARGALESYVDLRDDTRLRACLTDLHQVHGTLTMLELEGVAVLSGHMERLAQNLLNGTIADPDQGCEVLMQGIVELPMLLEEINRGTPDSVELVRAQADQLRAVLGLAPLESPNDGAPERDAAARARFLQIDGVDKIRRIRSAYQQVLLAILKGEQSASPTAGGALGKVALALIRVCEGTPFELLWKAFSEYAAALDASQRVPDAGALKLLRRIDAEIRTLGRDGDAALAVPPAQTLVRQLIDSARALGRTSETLDAIDAALTPSVDGADEISVQGREAMAAAASVLREELAEVCARLEQLLDDGDAARLGELVAPLKQTGSTLGLLGFESSRVIVLEQLERIAAVGRAGAGHGGGLSREDIEAMARALLRVDDNLAGMSRAGSEPQRVASDAQQAVVREARAGLDRIKQHVVSFVSGGWNRLALDTVPGELFSIAGALQLVPLAAGASCVADCRAYVQERLLVGDDPDWGSMDLLADAISGIDYYLERIADNAGAGAGEILATVERRLEGLGYLGRGAEVGFIGVSAAEELGGADEDPDEPVLEELGDGSGRIEDRAVVADEPVRQAPHAAPVTLPLPEPAADDGRDLELVAIFVEEVQGIMAEIDGAAGAVDVLRRNFHTLKGSGRMVGAAALGDIGWGVENLLNRVIEGTVHASPVVWALVADARAAMPALLDDFAAGRDPSVDTAALISRADWLASGAAVSDASASDAAASDAAASDAFDSDAFDSDAFDSDAFDSDAAASEAAARAAAPATDEASGEVLAEGVSSTFLAEAAGHLATLEAAPGSLDAERVRAWHTLAGGAALAGFEAVRVFVDPLYDCAAAWVGRPPSPELEQLLRRGVDLLGRTFATLAAGAEPPDPSQVVADADRLRAAAPVRALTGTALPQIETTFVFLDRWFEGALDLGELERIVDALAELQATAGESAIPEIQALARATRAAYEHLADGRLSEAARAALGAGHQALADQTDALAAGRPIEPAAGTIATLTALVPHAVVVPPVVAAPPAEPTRVGAVASPPPAPPVAATEDRSAADPAPAAAAAVTATEDTPVPIEALDEADAAASLKDVDREILAVFMGEADELLEAVDNGIQDWSGAPANRLFLENLLRALHTLKGGARLVGLTRLGDQTHHFESELIRIQQAGMPADAALFKALNERHDALLASFRATARAAAGRNAEPLPAETSAADDADAQDDFTAPPAEAGNPTARGRAAPGELVRVGAALLENLVNLAGESSILRARIEQGLANFAGALDEMETTIERVREQLHRLEIATEAQILFRHDPEPDGVPRRDDFDPLELDRYSHLQQLARALTESASDMLDLKETLRLKAREAESLLQHQARINTELQEGLMRTRMVPFSHLMPRLRRTVRQVARELDKDVSFEAYNTEGELDRNLLERMVPPLEHMLRNAVDHGIEPPTARRGFGKPETGRITLKLAREGGDVVIAISDDGAGIDAETVRAKAIERGLMAPDAVLNDDEVIQFILEPGFSTARQVTQISGRGVGMDVVQSAVKQLGGSITMFSRPGKGSRFTVRLPFSVSVSRALMVQTGDELYAVPLNTLEGILLLPPQEAERLRSTAGATLDYAGVPYRSHHLDHYLGRVSVAPPTTASAVPVVLVRAGDQAVAMLVDAVLGSREIVVKSLGPQFARVSGVSGATILGDGSVVVILDVHALIRARGVRPQEREPKAVAPPRSRCVMVVDDSVTVRKVTSRLLERRGMDVIVAKDGVEAVALLQERRPDVLLLDIEMPRMDGFEVARQVRHDERLGKLPIIMISSRTGKKHREHASDLGVDRFLGKPFQESELLSTIDELVGLA